jgi:serine protease Do
MTRPRQLRPAAARLAVVLSLLLASAAGRADPARTGAPERESGILRDMNSAVTRLAARVSPAVVQVQVTGYGLATEPGRSEAAFVARQHSIGSGVIVSPDGYILTNQHVVHGAQRIQVVLAAPARGAAAAADATSRRIFTASIVGVDPNVDLALLKIEARGLAFLPLDGAERVRQGEFVFAVGSPQGLASSVTMGIVSSADRQVDITQPMSFIQTDAPINPGNSGGPLVDVNGALVGINTFILSQSGGSQGLGFAIPSALARFVYQSLREHGRIHRIEVGATIQAISPALAAGLGLPRDWGVVISDVAPGSAAKAAGVSAGDVIESFDGHPIDDMAAITSALYLHPVDKPVALGVLRGKERVMLSISAPEATRPTDQLMDVADPAKDLVRKLGIVGVDVSAKLRGIISPLRIGKGVVVAARTLDATSVESGLQAGDVIHAVNRSEVDSVETLRILISAIKPGDPVAIQIERQGKLAYLAFDME